MELWAASQKHRSAVFSFAIVLESGQKIAIVVGNIENGNYSCFDLRGGCTNFSCANFREQTGIWRQVGNNASIAS